MCQNTNKKEDGVFNLSSTSEAPSCCRARLDIIGWYRTKSCCLRSMHCLLYAFWRANLRSILAIAPHATTLLGLLKTNSSAFPSLNIVVAVHCGAVKSDRDEGTVNVRLLLARRHSLLE